MDMHPAGSYENGQTVQTYGGGIARVSTTLYNGSYPCRIKDRRTFSTFYDRTLMNQDLQMQAIAGTHKDMKFKNTFDTPIYIEGKANGSTITFTVYGKKRSKTYSRILI